MANHHNIYTAINTEEEFDAAKADPAKFVEANSVHNPRKLYSASFGGWIPEGRFDAYDPNSFYYRWSLRNAQQVHQDHE